MTIDTVLNNSLQEAPTFVVWVRSIIRSIIPLVMEDGSGDEGGLWTVDLPEKADHGHAATNVAMVLGRRSGQDVRILAEALAHALAQHPQVQKAWCAGPGFVNMSFTPDVWRYYTERAVKEGRAYGSLSIGRGTPVHIEFVSANPTGPLHVGHLRGAILGDVLARLLEKVGYKPWREYYVNDAGAQIDGLALSVYQRYLQALNRPAEPSERLPYSGDYLIPLGQELATIYGDDLVHTSDADRLVIIKAFAVPAMMDAIRHDLGLLNIHFDCFFSEKDLVDQGANEKIETLLHEKGLLYQGVLDVPKGKKIDEWEAREQTLFKATLFGDDTDRPIKKSDGSWTYFASDMAYHLSKYQRGFTQLINVFGADHAGYLARLKAACAAISDGSIDLDIKVCQLVRLSENGVSMRMSKRAGHFVTLREVVDEVGADCVRFMMLTKKNDAPLNFDFVKAKEQSKDNWVFYVQYAHARICSVFRLAQEEGFDTSVAALLQAPFLKLEDELEQAIQRKVSFYSSVLAAAATAHEPHRVVFYLHDLAGLFHELWNKGKEATHLRFIVKDDNETTLARLYLLSAIRHTLASGLEILGVTPVEEMR